MKKLKLPQQKKSNEIDWDIPQWVIAKNGDVVLTTGNHNGRSFSGTCMPCKGFPKGIYLNTWFKPNFTRLNFVILFVINNTED